jgi:gliding motility-associated-like protein
MKKLLLCFFVFLSAYSFGQSPGCNIQAIRAAMQTAGYYELTVPSQPCSMYFINPTSQNFAFHEQAAQQYGAHVVSFSNQQENMDVLNAMYSSPYSPANYGIWLGLTDAQQEGTFIWLDGTPLTYTNWSPGEPNNTIPPCCNIPIIGCQPPDIRCQYGEDCLQMYGNGLWNDWSCDANNISVLEFNLCMQVTATNDTTICQGTSITLSAAGRLGSTPFTYNWNPGNATGSTYVVTPNSNTTYTVRATDRWGCFADDTVHVNIQTCGSQPGCDVNAIRAAFTAAGYNELTGVQGQPCSMYFINPTSQNANLSEQAAQQLGAHLVVFNNAAENQAVVAALNAAGIISAVDAVWIGYSDEINEGSWIALDGTNMSYLNWAPNEPNNNGQGDACCNFPDWLGGCQTSEAWRCQYGEDCAQIYSSGQWNDLPCNRNSVSVVEVNLCPVLTVSNDTTICTGNSVTLTASAILGSNPYTYSWNPGNVTTASYTVTPANTTAYISSVTDRWGCFATDTVNVTVQGGGTQSFTVNPNPVCENVPVTVTYTGTSPSNATYTWGFDGGTIVSGSGQGPYEIVWSGTGSKTIALDVSSGGCAFPQVTQPVTINANPVADAGTDATVCSGNSVQLGAATVAGYTYQWLPAANLSSSNIANPVCTATNTGSSPLVIQYILSVMQNNCADADTVTVTINPSSPTTISATGNTGFCSGGSVTLNADSVFSAYLWSNNQPTASVTVTQSGTYTLTGTDANGCQYISNSITVTAYPNPALSLVSSTDESCAGFANGTITVTSNTGTAPFNYVWNTTPPQNSATAISLSAGSYHVTVTDINNCSATGSYSVNAALPLTITVNNITNTSCAGLSDGAISVTANGGTPAYNYAWNTGSTANPLTGVDAGTYNVTVTDANNCTVDTSLTVTGPPPISLLAPDFDSIQFGTEIQLTTNVQPAGGIYTYEWSPANYLSCTNCPAPYFSAIRSTEYQLTVTDAFGCSVTATVQVTVMADKPVFFPNVFTPNGDSQNDNFSVFTTGVSYYNLRVFNRWGEKVFETYNTGTGWDGTYAGKDAAPGVYSYTAIITFLDGENRTYKGTVTLLR